MVKNSLILFDCFGVLFTAFMPDWFYRYFPKEEADQLFAYYSEKGDLGEITFEECADELIHKHGLTSLTIEQIIHEWIEIAKPNQELIAKIKELRKYNKVALVSNAWVNCVERMFMYYNISMNIFDHCFISYQYKIRKPNLNFFQTALDYFKGEHFENVYMIDDHETSMINIDKLGIKPTIFKDNSSIDFLLK